VRLTNEVNQSLAEGYILQHVLCLQHH